MGDAHNIQIETFQIRIGVHLASVICRSAHAQPSSAGETK